MSRLIQLNYNGGKILVESTDVVDYQGSLVATAGATTDEKNVEKMLEVIKPFCEALRKSVDSLGDDKPGSSSAEDLDLILLEKAIYSLLKSLRKLVSKLQ